jgi:hypothetical protein
MRVAPLAGTIVDAAMRVFSDSDRNPLATQARKGPPKPAQEKKPAAIQRQVMISDSFFVRYESLTDSSGNS